MILAISIIVIAAMIAVLMVNAQKKFIRDVNKILDVLNKEAEQVADESRQVLNEAKYWSEQLHAEAGYGRKPVKEIEDDSIVILTKERDSRIIESLDKERGY